ncbi:uncharacterized protein LOC107048946 [Diachasma alloeum]|uniref:uncharacterized protein LOC107048946 n=1 Tax=Diachasma alloeum TaxID=454923 RepID=UPI00073844E5|nr:uncharacterized protein LOC107048946 [Diachasma alloeum]
MSESRHHLRSVSDLYAADEIEVLLLEEIRDLEPPPTAYSRPEDIQDFEIAGSRTGGAISSHSSELDSPGVHSTVHSWDSHENYHGPYGHGNHRHGSSGNALPWPRASHLVLVCDIQGHLKTTTGVVRILLLITSAACLATLCSSGTASVNLFMLPLVGRLRFMIFVTVFCLLVTILLLFLDITHVVYMFPLNWDKVNFWVFTGIGVSYTAGSGLLGLSIWEYHGTGWVPRRTRSQLTVAAGIAVSCALFAFLLSWIHGRTGVNCKSQSHDHSQSQLYKPVDSTSSGMTLKDKSPKPASGWVVKSQKTKKSVDTESNTTSKGNGNCEKYKSRKDHWASARDAFLPQEDEEVQTMQRDESDLEKKRRRRRRDGSGSSGNGVAGKKVEPPTGRRVPQKLPLKQIERPQPRRANAGKGPTVKTSRTSTNSDFQSCLAATVKEWEMQGATEAERVDAAKAIEVAMWSSQWRQPPDDVQPCSSKTVDPYPFP